MMIKKWFMTPNVGIRYVSEDRVFSNRSKIIAYSGGGTGGQDYDKTKGNNKAMLDKIDSSRHEGSHS